MMQNLPPDYFKPINDYALQNKAKHEGYKAFYDGIMNHEKNPYTDINHSLMIQWFIGYDLAKNVG